MRRRHALLITLALAAPLSVAPAAASPVKLPVTATVHTTFDEGPHPFTSSVPGCPTGMVTNVPPSARFTPWGGVFRGVKSFECDSGTGGFAVRLVARFGENGSTGTWTLVEAWGDYAGAKGSGTLVGVPVEGGIDDHYAGMVR